MTSLLVPHNVYVQLLSLWWILKSACCLLSGNTDRRQPHSPHLFQSISQYGLLLIVLVFFFFVFCQTVSKQCDKVRVPVDPHGRGSLYALLREDVWASNIFNVQSVIKTFSILNHKRCIFFLLKCNQIENTSSVNRCCHPFFLKFAPFYGKTKWKYSCNNLLRYFCFFFSWTVAVSLCPILGVKTCFGGYG